MRIAFRRTSGLTKRSIRILRSVQRANGSLEVMPTKHADRIGRSRCQGWYGQHCLRCVAGSKRLAIRLD